MEDTVTSTALPKVAFLGPLGTYSHQSTHDRFGDNVAYVDKPTISAVFDSISSEMPYGVVPQQNSTFGSVIETYDNLRRSTLGTSMFVRGEVTMSVHHCLVVRSGIKRKDIVRIVSHEQALGQCTQYLSTHFPKAIRQKMPSTATAARSLLEAEDEISEEDSQLAGESAAICSSLCANMFGLDILEENIQDRSDNFTRFFVLSASLEAKPPYLPYEPQLFRALIRLGVLSGQSDSSQNPVFERRPLQMVVSTLLTTFSLPVTRIDRRPSLSSATFEDVYFLELEELGSPPDPRGLDDRDSAYDAWLNQVRQATERANVSGVEAVLLGAW